MTASTDTHSVNANSYNAISTQYLSWSLAHQPSADTDTISYNDSSLNSSRLIYLSRLLSHLLSPATAHILDLGCGAGLPCTRLLAQICHQGKVIGVDSSSAQIALARKYVLGDTKDGEKNIADVELFVADTASCFFPPGTLDAVVAFYSIIHLPRDEQQHLLENVATWLQVGSEDDERGYLLLNFGARDDPGSYAENWNGWRGGNMYWSSYDAATNLKMVEMAGFEIVESAVVEDDEDGRKVPFLWVLAKKK